MERPGHPKVEGPQLLATCGKRFYLCFSRNWAINSGTTTTEAVHPTRQVQNLNLNGPATRRQWKTRRPTLSQHQATWRDLKRFVDKAKGLSLTPHLTAPLLLVLLCARLMTRVKKQIHTYILFLVPLFWLEILFQGTGHTLWLQCLWSFWSWVNTQRCYLHNKKKK